MYENLKKNENKKWERIRKSAIISNNLCIYKRKKKLKEIEKLNNLTVVTGTYVSTELERSRINYMCIFSFVYLWLIIFFSNF